MTPLDNTNPRGDAALLAAIQSPFNVPDYANRVMRQAMGAKPREEVDVQALRDELMLRMEHVSGYRNAIADVDGMGFEAARINLAAYEARVSDLRRRIINAESK